MGVNHLVPRFHSLAVDDGPLSNAIRVYHKNC